MSHAVSIDRDPRVRRRRRDRRAASTAPLLASACGQCDRGSRRRASPGGIRSGDRPPAHARLLRGERRPHRGLHRADRPDLRGRHGRRRRAPWSPAPSWPPARRPPTCCSGSTTPCCRGRWTPDVFAPYTAADLEYRHARPAHGHRPAAWSRPSTTATCASTSTTPRLAKRGLPAPTTARRPHLGRSTATCSSSRIPGTSSPGLAFLLATIARYGDGWQDYWASLDDNGVRVAGSWTDAYDGAVQRRGRTAIDPSSCRTRRARRPRSCTRPIRSRRALDVGHDRRLLPPGRVRRRPGRAPPTPTARSAVVDWLLSEPVQADVPLSMFVFPAREGTPLPRCSPTSPPTVDDPLQLPPAEVAANLSTWLADWGTVMGR